MVGSALTIIRLSGASGTGTSVRWIRNCPDCGHDDHSSRRYNVTGRANSSGLQAAGCSS